MSSGLTYCIVWDLNAGAPSLGGTATVFSQYDEARAWALFLGTDVGPDYIIYIWTSGPGQNGYQRSTTFTEISPS